MFRAAIWSSLCFSCVWPVNPILHNVFVDKLRSSTPTSLGLSTWRGYQADFNGRCVVFKMYTGVYHRFVISMGTRTGVLSGTAPQIIRSSVSNSAGWELNSKSVFLAGNFPTLITCWVKVLKCSFWLGKKLNFLAGGFYNAFCDSLARIGPHRARGVRKLMNLLLERWWFLLANKDVLW